MVEEAFVLDDLFGSLSDPTRRDIVDRLRSSSMSVGAIANHYGMSYAGVAKHLEVLQRARLVQKSRRGKERIVSVVPGALAAGNAYFEQYRSLWERHLDALERYLSTPQSEDV